MLLPSVYFIPNQYSWKKLKEFRENKTANARFRHELLQKQINSNYINEYNRIKSILDNHVLKDADMERLSNRMTELRTLFEKHHK
jgi:hypothetical protein